MHAVTFLANGLKAAGTVDEASGKTQLGATEICIAMLEILDGVGRNLFVMTNEVSAKIGHDRDLYCLERVDTPEYLPGHHLDTADELLEETGTLVKEHNKFIRQLGELSGPDKIEWNHWERYRLAVFEAVDTALAFSLYPRKEKVKPIPRVSAASTVYQPVPHAHGNFLLLTHGGQYGQAGNNTQIYQPVSQYYQNALSPSGHALASNQNRYEGMPMIGTMSGYHGHGAGDTSAYQQLGYTNGASMNAQYSESGNQGFHGGR